MALTAINGNTSAQQTLAGGDELYVGLDGEIYHDGSGAVIGTSAGDVAVTVLGVIYSTVNGAIDFYDNISQHDVTIAVGSSGSIISHFSFTLDIDARDAVYITNAGMIASLLDQAIWVVPEDTGVGIDIRNSGTITSQTNTLSLQSGINRTDVANSGLIVGGEFAVYINSDYTFSPSRITNSGRIETHGDYAIIKVGIGALTVKNTGTVIGNVQMSNAVANDTVVNSGEILGDIELRSGADLYSGAGGFVSGTVDGGPGTDTLAGGEGSDDLAGGSEADTIIGRGGDDILNGDGGNDMLLAGDGNDRVNGGTNNDTINGNAGDDTLFGDAGHDVLVGQDGSDFLDGGVLNDTLDGGNGDDVLEGGSGNDILRGRAGEDNLAGGLGLDLLTGGQDADSFVFRSTAETVVGANRDQILDFEQGLDLIVVSGLSPGVFEFRGTSPFSPSGTPELRLFETPTGSTIVQLDANGDGTQDAEIRVANVTGLTAGDFVL